MGGHSDQRLLREEGSHCPVEPRLGVLDEPEARALPHLRRVARRAQGPGPQEREEALRSPGCSPRHAHSGLHVLEALGPSWLLDTAASFAFSFLFLLIVAFPYRRRVCVG